MSKIHTVLLLTLALSACGDKDGDDTSTGDGGSSSGDGGAASGDCADPSVNAFAGTCVETFMAGCFDPAGECDGTVDMATGSTSLAWENGASVQSEVDSSNPASPSVETTISGSDGTVCAIGTSQYNAGGCASRTVYVRQSDGAEQVWCIQADGSMEVTCSDGGSVSVTAAQAQTANSCGFAGSGEPCDISY